MDEGEQDQQTTDNSQTLHGEVADSVKDDALDDVKKRALEALVPIIADLDVSPEQKFDICITAMRFTDNKQLANTALEAALAIEDNGPKAEALVELVNEINYLQQV